MNSYLVFVLLIMLTGNVISATTPPSIPLWPEGAPNAQGNEEKDIPSIQAYLPDKDIASGSAIIICPGGGYGHLASHEGEGYALWLNKSGIAGFVLKYRLGSKGYRHPCMLQDASRAIRWVRAHAKEYGLDPRRIGIMGSSAGGHLASTVLTHFTEGDPHASDLIERESSRPDLGILCYAVISMGPNTHQGSRNNLLGNPADPKLIQLLSNELHVSSNTPSCFIWHTFEDTAVKVENSLDFAAALRKAGVPFDLHIYQKGGHGMGLGKNHPWGTDCLYWLKAQGFIKAEIIK